MIAFFLKDIKILLLREKLYFLSTTWTILIQLFFKILFQLHIYNSMIIPIFWMAYLLGLPILFSESASIEYKNNIIHLWIKKQKSFIYIIGKILASWILCAIHFFIVFFFWYLFFEYEILIYLEQSHETLGKVFVFLLLKTLWITFLYSLFTPFIYYLSFQTNHPYLYGKLMAYLNSLWILFIIFN